MSNPRDMNQAKGAQSAQCAERAGPGITSAAAAEAIDLRIRDLYVQAYCIAFPCAVEQSVACAIYQGDIYPAHELLDPIGRHQDMLPALVFHANILSIATLGQPAWPVDIVPPVQDHEAGHPKVAAIIVGAGARTAIPRVAQTLFAMHQWRSIAQVGVGAFPEIEIDLYAWRIYVDSVGRVGAPLDEPSCVRALLGQEMATRYGGDARAYAACIGASLAQEPAPGPARYPDSGARGLSARQKTGSGPATAPQTPPAQPQQRQPAPTSPRTTNHKERAPHDTQ